MTHAHLWAGVQRLPLGLPDREHYTETFYMWECRLCKARCWAVGYLTEGGGALTPQQWEEMAHAQRQRKDGWAEVWRTTDPGIEGVGSAARRRLLTGANV